MIVFGGYIVEQNRLITRVSFIVAGVTSLLSFALFYYDTGEASKSLYAGLITGGLVWATYMVLRWLVLACKPQ